MNNTADDQSVDDPKKEEISFDDFLLRLSEEVSPDVLESVSLREMGADLVKAENDEQREHLRIEQVYHHHSFFAADKVREPFEPDFYSLELNVGETELKYLAERGKNTPLSLKGALYCDFCWVFKDQGTLPEPHTLAARALDGYISFLTKCYKTHYFLLVMKCFYRVLQLKHELKADKNDELAKIVDLVRDEFLRSKHFIDCANLIWKAFKAKIPNCDTALEETVNLLKERLDGDFRNPMEGAEHFDLALEIARSNHTDLLSEEEVKTQAQKYWENAVASESQRSEGISSLFWARKATEWLQNKSIQLPEAIRSLSQQSAIRSVENMKKYEGSVRFPRKVVEDFVNHFHSLDSSIDRLCYFVNLFTETDPADTSKTDLSIVDLIQSTQILPDGGASFERSGFDNHSLSTIHTHLQVAILNSNIIYFQAGFPFKLSKKDTLDFLKSHTLYPANMDRQFVDGYRAFLRGDFLKAILFLTPIFENCIRKLFIIAGKTNLIVKADSQEPAPLNTLLQDEYISSIYGQPLVDVWRYVFVIKDGMNIRNHFMHGLNSDNDGGYSNAALVFGFLLRLLIETNFTEIGDNE